MWTPATRSTPTSAAWPAGASSAATPPARPAPAARPASCPATTSPAARWPSSSANAAGYSDAIPSTQQTFTDVPYSSPFWLYVERAVAARGDQRLHHQPALHDRRALLPARQQRDARPDGQVRQPTPAGYSDPIPSTQQTFTDVPYEQPVLALHRAGGAARGDQRLHQQPALHTGVPSG